MSNFGAGVVIGLSVVSAVFANVADGSDTRLVLLISAILLLVVGTALLLKAPAGHGVYRCSPDRAALLPDRTGGDTARALAVSAGLNSTNRARKHYSVGDVEIPPAGASLSRGRTSALPTLERTAMSRARWGGDGSAKALKAAIGIAGSCAAWARAKALATAARATRQRLMAALAGRSEHERFLAGSVDHFDVERREREWDRWQSRNGSLLGW
jgi:hypothetical protein